MTKRDTEDTNSLAFPKNQSSMLKKVSNNANEKFVSMTLIMVVDNE